MRFRRIVMLAVFGIVSVVCGVVDRASAQPLGQPDRGSPGDEMIQAYLAQQALSLESGWLADTPTHADWEAARPRYMREYFYMLGLDPLPERTDLHATVTGRLEHGDVTIEKLHYQSRPQLYVTANLYRPKTMAQGQRLPAVLYVCGHSHMGRNGNKTAYQSHGLWLARHGYICLMVDTLQLGEIAATHHGTYNLERWWWHSRGYTPAGVECWNGMRGIDYLISRGDVDAERIGVTGISGGGAATFWIAAADPRVRVAVPVSGMADLTSYVPNRVIDGHCDCMFLYNTYRWPWTRIAGLIAPRPLLFVNSNNDDIFPLDADERVINRLERLYSLFGAGDRVDSLISVGGHAYRSDIRQGAYRFLNTYLQGNSAPVTDSEVDLVTDNPAKYPIEPESLRVFPSDGDLPHDQLNTTIDEHFVPLANLALPAKGEYESWRKKLVGELRSVSFAGVPDPIPSARPKSKESDNDNGWFIAESNVKALLRRVEKPKSLPSKRTVLLVQEGVAMPDWLKPMLGSNDNVYALEVRGLGSTAWTHKNPPNYVERAHVLLGRTVDAGRIWDVAGVACMLRDEDPKVPVIVAAEGAQGLLAAYAGVLAPEIAGVIVNNPPTSHMQKGAPQLLNVLRVCDVPDVLGAIAPRQLTVLGSSADGWKKTAAIYAAAGAGDELSFK